MKRPRGGVEFGRDGRSSPWTKTTPNGFENKVVTVVGISKRFDDGLKLPAIKWARRRPLSTRGGRSNFGSHERYLWYQLKLLLGLPSSCSL